MVKSKRVAFHTLGCKLNFAETSGISRMFSQQRAQLVSFREPADVYIIHSCSVTAKADRKTLALVRQARRQNPDATVAVIGCYAQLNAEELKAMEEVDIILGTREKYRLAAICMDRTRDKVMEVSDKDIHEDLTFKPAYSSGDRTRSFLKVQDGCDYHCAYCTVPYARGRSRNNSISQVVKNVRDIALTGVKEVILTGVNIGDFGKNTGESFLELIKALDKEEGIPRFRISSIEPDLLTMDIIDFISRSHRFVPHFHIPLQSGSDQLLKRMGRRYNAEGFEKKLKHLKEKMPRACVAVDLIVGLPGETEKQFNATRQLVESLPISYLHVFSFSPRPNTKAAHMKGQVPEKLKKERSAIMRALSEQMKEKYYRSQKGSKQQVLWESKDNENKLQGWTGNYIRVKRPYDAQKTNTIEEVVLHQLINGSYHVH